MVDQNRDDEYDENDDDDIAELSYDASSENGYLNFRFQAYRQNNEDDDAYDNDNPFPYDPDTAPDATFYWDRQSVTVWGDCSTCTAIDHWVADDCFRDISRATHALFASLGMALGFLGWTLYTTIIMKRAIVRVSRGDESALVAEQTERRSET